MARAAPAPDHPSHDHPSAARDSIHVGALIYGLAAAPGAWLAAQVASSTLAQAACFPQDTPLRVPAFPGVHLAHGVALAIALAVCVSGALVAYGAWRRTRGEHTGGGHALLDIGEGRSRFLALAGLMTSLGFLVATVFSIPAALLVPAC